MLFSLGQIEIILVLQGGSPPSPSLPLPHLDYASVLIPLKINFLVQIGLIAMMLLHKFTFISDLNLIPMFSAFSFLFNISFV